MGRYGYEHGVCYTHWDDWKGIIDVLEYPDVRTAIIKEYEKSGSLCKTAEVFSVGKSTIWNKLTAFKYDKIKGRGGPNNPTGINRGVRNGR